MDLLDRLHRRLLDEARRSRPADAPAAPTIAEVYQQLVPYRAVRGELGILELAEYEYALLRLLAGERGYARLEHPAAQEELRRELASPSPILGVYRDYAGVGVQLSDEGAPFPFDDAPPGADALPVAETPPGPPDAGDAPPPSADRPWRDAPGTEGDACLRCGDPLPQHPDLRYCPACGADQREVPCAGCGLPLEPGWRFCVRCGVPVEAGGAR